MLFNSYSFLFVFAPLAIGIYWLLLSRLNRPEWPVAWLCACSYAFYLGGELSYPWLIPLSIGFNYGIGIGIAGAANRKHAKRFLLAGLAGNLLLLGYFKYFGFFHGELVTLGILEAGASSIVLPIGISFYTFTQIAFLVDAFHGKAEERRFLPYFLFVTFFPHLIAGPILHHKEMMPQFMRAGSHRIAERLFAGIGLFAIGLAKKTLIADEAGRIASTVFAAADSGIGPGLIDAWAGALAYTVQIYFDFSGYSDMAIGLSRMLGINIPINFNSPYKSDSIIEFWRRWHITLSRFLRDYLYIPLGGSKKGKLRRHANLLITMLLGGLWHGAGWTFIVWGGMHGVLLLVAHGWREMAAVGRLPKIPRFLGWLVTFLVVVLAWVPFRSTSMDSAARLWGGMVGLNGLGLPDFRILHSLADALGVKAQASLVGGMDPPVILLALMIAFLAPNSQEIMQRFRTGLTSPGYGGVQRIPPLLMLRFGWISAIVLGCLIGLGLRSIGGYSEFIYFQF